MYTAKALEAVCVNVARILKEERVKRGLSMTVLAQRAGLSQAMISFVERDIRNPSLETLLRITGVLEIHLDEVIRRARVAAARRKAK
ncbi:MAG: helix-turn-helix domain-containing protein [Limisphaerales bacterium]